MVSAMIARQVRSKLRTVSAGIQLTSAASGTIANNDIRATNGTALDIAAAFTGVIEDNDFHHSAMVALTGRSEAYYSDYRGTAQEFISAIKYGYLFQGQWYSWQGKRRGQPGLDVPPDRFITFLQNHDQIAHSGRGLRAHQLTSAGRYRAMTALFLLAPNTRLLFQGQEFAASSPFLYFADHGGELGQAVREGRAGFMKQFRSAATRPLAETLPDPRDPDTFARCKLDHTPAGCECAERVADGVGAVGKGIAFG